MGGDEFFLREWDRFCLYSSAEVPKRCVQFSETGPGRIQRILFWEIIVFVEMGERSKAERRKDFYVNEIFSKEFNWK